MSSHATSKRVPSSPRADAGQSAWELVALFGILVAGFVALGVGYFAFFPKDSATIKAAPTWEVQDLPVEDDGVKCYILTTPKGAVDLECLPYHYEGEETQDEYETRA